MRWMVSTIGVVLLTRLAQPQRGSACSYDLQWERFSLVSVSAESASKDELEAERAALGEVLRLLGDDEGQILLADLLDAEGLVTLEFERIAHADADDTVTLTYTKNGRIFTATFERQAVE